MISVGLSWGHDMIFAAAPYTAQVILLEHKNTRMALSRMNRPNSPL